MTTKKNCAEAEKRSRLKKNDAKEDLPALPLRKFVHVYINNYKITELLRARSLVGSCVKMRVCKHRCDVLDLRVLLKIIL